jgi:hypothetical protein
VRTKCCEIFHGSDAQKMRLFKNLKDLGEEEARVDAVIGTHGASLHDRVS